LFLPASLELGLEKDLAAFCSQECFKGSWTEHKKLHKPSAIEGWHYCTRRGQGRSLNMPDFKWTGDLRPARIGPMRPIPDHIPKPDYYLTGYPAKEMESRQQHAVKIRTEKDVAGIREACRIGREVLDLAAAAIRPGVTTDEIDRVVHEATIAAGAYPSPYNYFNFPKSVCTSINEIICHGIPDRRKLEEGDIVNVDVSVYYKGYHGDLNETVVVGEVDEASKQLVKVTYECLHKAIAICKPGTPYREIGEVITKHAKAHGMSVVRTYCGHGIGDLFHCAPNVPHYAKNKAKGTMKVGEVFTIEPMINLGSHRDKTWPDGWTSATEDGQRSAQFEHTLVITPTGYDILTARQPTSPPLWWEREGVQPEGQAAAAAASGGS
jgi:methionyl aminopeptidase